MSRPMLRASTKIISSSARIASRAAPLLVRQQAARSFSSTSTRSFGALRAFTVPVVQKDVRAYSSKNFPAHNVIAMPALSPTMTAGGIGKFQKAVGDAINPGDVLVEIETDKAQMDFECQDEGFLAKILIGEGDKDVPVGKPIAILVEDEADIEAFKEFTLEDAGSAEPVKEEPTPAKEAPAPVKEEKKQEAKPTPSPPAAAAAAPAPVAPVPAAYAPQGGAAGDAFNDQPTTNMRKIIASRLTESKQTVPHYYLTVEVDMDKVNKLRQVLNQSSEGQYKLSVNDFIVKASALALKAVPEVNSAWQGDFIRQYHHADVCVAVATPTGLITPIVTKAETKGLSTISSQVKDLAKRARDGKLAPQEYQGGSFTISNLGMFGISNFTAIINPPQSCILAIGGTQKKVVPDQAAPSGFSSREVMEVTLSADHRVVDGAVGATWLQSFKTFMENPLKMLL
ncbi:Dihydrolipoyllysine-residue acetyltransferase component of pyruvate dehydrogenase complex, mitochondrial [Choanephora cucurbitarum]|uniref:Dihydrolipoamide acetyltransferase component of pyruvate dehydrogenase complex n=1 Tax=Choanephora cucurbitarum TaxID=101091 RepID=A0A1C7NC22_9FUNG|nr:Dihydrolipoyllysine-residue acetyltransferase component of pyruvate dehydrogenase complex, mitochondrial [Choanephora cucurbitarum]